ncbi:MAG TPA: hypothetical protein VFM46_18625, partial [Pseudomonadales bacterium]|nr:hypothetical protein [Pseudomonadales bacterium]
MKATHITLFLLAAFFSRSIFADIDISTRVAAAKETSEKNKICKGLAQFYWEIGDASSVLASGKVGTLFDKDRVYSLASASKLPFATYVLQRIKTPNADQLQKMQMSAGYNNFNPISCLFTKTVNECFNILGNSKRTASEVGLFYYTDGHDNKLAIDLGMGNFTA